MREVHYALSFKRDLKQARRAGLLTLEELEHVVGMLRMDTPLPPHMRDHPLQGKWKPARECHVHPDLLLVYAKTTGSLHLRRLASHSELF